MYTKKNFQKKHQNFSSKDEILSEIINLKAIQNLPKGTEFFISDIHGEFEGFNHMINIGSGIIKDKIELCFDKEELTESVKKELVKLIAYPEEVLRNKKEHLASFEFCVWCKETMRHLIKLIIFCSSKYSRSKLRKRLPKKYIYLGEELIYTNPNEKNKSDYFENILDSIFQLGIIEDVILEFSKSLKFIVIDHIHIVGDIFDRGAQSSEVISLLKKFPSIDIQWGNHDILWLGAYCGSEACLLTLLRIATRYGYLFELEKNYGLNLRSLFQFSEQNYQYISDFSPKRDCKKVNQESFSKVQQALLIMQLKLEGQIIHRNPEFNMDDSLYLDKISSGMVSIDGKIFPLATSCFQLVDPHDPYKLNEDEKKVIIDLMYSFQHSSKLREELIFLYEKGSLYLTYNDHLLFHGCIPLNEHGDFQFFLSKEIAGSKLMDYFEKHIRQAYEERDNLKNFSLDILWYCWCGRLSPLFGRKKMKTFERYFINDTTIHKEENNSYYSLRENSEICKKILKEFQLHSAESCIINGHTPIKVKHGESPIKGGGKLFVIDGGLSKPYQKSTGIAGYTLLNNSYGFQLVTHTPFSSVKNFLQKETDCSCLTKVIDQTLPRKLICQTSIGKILEETIEELSKDYLLF